MLRMAYRRHSNLEGMLTWAFEFDDQPYFDGFRTLATNGIDKPILNVFRMFGLMRGERVRAQSSGAIGLDDILQSGVRGAPDVDALATRAPNQISILAWNYHDDDVPGPGVPIDTTVTGIPAEIAKALVRHYRIDQTHSNAYTAWKEMGSPQNPSPGQYARLEAAGQLQTLGSPAWMPVEKGALRLRFTLPRQAISLIQVSW
jgi:xylan 1,4-beta-xylosidase